MSEHNYSIDLDDLGDAIADIVDKAVKSKDFQELNKNITKVVGNAVDVGSASVRRAVRNARAANYKPNKNIYSSKLGSQSAYRQVEEPAKNLPVLYGSSSGKMAFGICKTVGGGIMTLGSTTSLLVTGLIRSVLATGAFLSASSVLLLAELCGGIYLLTSGIKTIGKMNRFEKYVRTLGKRTYCDMEMLARSVGKPVKYVQKELGGMINSGLFLEGHIDDDGKSLITSDETFRHYQQTRLQMEEKKRQERAEAKLLEQKKAEAKVSAQVQEVLDKGNAYVREIRRCNDRIPGEEISEKISRMELIVKKIFDRAEAHPEIVPDLKKMMDYYLPMTVKLLIAYADMDAQPIQGETIQNSKREIEATLDTLNAAFEKLLDSVFKDTAMDVSSDISVLQTLLAQEGLTDDGFDMK